jgi:hypothetical protein
MQTCARLILAAVIGLASAASVASPAVKAAAARFMEGVQWQEQSVLTADFSCSGKPQSAILGIAKNEIVVAVFTQDLGRAPEVLRFSSDERRPGEAKIRIDDSALSREEITTLAGTAPPGYRPSKTCKGVRLSDDASDAAHIYWDHDARRFDSWSQ